MADTKTPLIQLDTGKAITSLKEFKQYLDDLKGALLGLEKGSEEYNKVAKDLRDGQQKLNDVMYEARKNSEAAEGSYDALVAKMRDLRKEWRATTDDMKRQDIGKQILDINNQLKDLDASTGNFQRNVGDYKNAFADAFDKMLGPLGKVGGSLGTLARDVKGMIPLIKSVNTTATAGLKGIKAAIASTGIGLLIVAVGELAANWEKVTKWLGLATSAQDAYTEALGRTKAEIDRLQLRIAEFNKDADEVEKQRKILFEGYTEVTFAEERLTNAQKTQKEATDALNKALGERKTAYENLTKAQNMSNLSSAQAYIRDEEIKKANEQLVLSMINVAKAQDTVGKAAEGVKVSEQNLENAKKKETDATKTNTSAHKDAKNTYNEEQRAVEDLIERLKKYRESIGQGETWFVEGQFEKYKKELDDAFGKGLIKPDVYKDAIRDLGIWYRREFSKVIKENAEEISAEIKAAYDEEIKNIDGNLTNALKQLDFQRKLQEHLKKFEPEPTFGQKIADSFNNIFGSQETIYKDFDKRAKVINENFALEKATSEQKIALYKEQLEGFNKMQEAADKQREKDLENGKFYDRVDYTKTEEYLEVQRALADEEMNLDNMKTQNFLDNADLEDERDEELAKAKQARMQLIGTSIQATSNLLTSFANLQEQQIKDDVANGKISEKEANKKFKRVKMLQKAAAIMETAQAAMGAYSSLASIPYVGPALGIAAAAAAVAQGMMQIKQIDKTTLSSSNSSGLSTATPDMNTVTNTYEPTYVTNMQSNTELSELANVVGSVQPVVRVTDIEDTQNTVKVRDEESSY